MYVLASLMEDLITTLEQECQIYEALIPYSEEKTQILVKEDLKGLERVTNEEQKLLDRVLSLDKQRDQIMENVGMVLGKKPEELKIAVLAQMLDKQPEQQKQLFALHDRLRKVMRALVSANEKNKGLIENSLEMIEFNMNYIQSTRMSPGSNNYNSDASSNYSTGMEAGAFDAKQ